MGHVGVCRILIEKGFSTTNKKDSSGESALHIAIKYNHIEVIKELIRLGSNVYAKGNRGNTALHHAVRAGVVEMTLFLTNHVMEVTMDILWGTLPVTRDERPFLTVERVSEIYDRYKLKRNRRNDANCFRIDWCLDAAVDIYEQVSPKFKQMICKPTESIFQYFLDNFNPNLRSSFNHAKEYSLVAADSIETAEHLHEILLVFF